MDSVERSFRCQKNGALSCSISLSYLADACTDKKVDDHTKASVQKHDPSIQQLAHNYNKLCNKMQELITQRKAPQGATVPENINMAGLFALDVNDTIWQDVGLADENLTEPPLWMCNDDVQRGIKALLEHDHCLEEEAHLVHERRALQVWFLEEWKIVMEGCEATGVYCILILVGLAVTGYISFVESDCL